jgi:hypothetical protein
MGNLLPSAAFDWNFTPNRGHALVDLTGIRFHSHSGLIYAIPQIPALTGVTAQT